MGRRRVTSDFDRVLRRHIESMQKKGDVPFDELVNHLRSTYPLYRRKAQKPFANYVSRVRQKSGRRNEGMDDSKVDDGDTPVLKKRRKIDEEKKLRPIKVEHVLSRRGDVANSSGGASSSSLASASSSDEDEEATTSEDAEKVEPQLDLMKSMLRESLRRKSKGGRELSEAVELQIVGNKKVNLVNEDRKLGSPHDKIKNDNGCSGPTFKDFGGLGGVIKELKRDVIVPLLYPYLNLHLGLDPKSGILLHGPPGCGKTKLARAIGNEARLPFYEICATDLVSGLSGASEENIRELFSKANRTAPSIVFIDEIDVIASKRDNSQREMDRRIAVQLMKCMEYSFQVNESENSEGFDSPPGNVLVIGATNRPDALDPGLRRPGRFDREIELGFPDVSARMEILSVLTRKMKLEDGFDLEKLARATPGFVGADLVSLATTAGDIARNRILDEREAELCSEDSWRLPWSHNEMEKLRIVVTDFKEAAKMVQSSSRREGFSAMHNVKWDDVGGFHFLRRELDLHIVNRIKFPNDYEDMGMELTTGFLLYGPPGCGKTLIAKAVANEAGANFIHIKGPELLNKYVGESELAVRTLFRRARTCSPCIVFFDEVDALTTSRGREGGLAERLVNQLLVELDGAEQRTDVYVIGATNRPEIMDPAFTRPGRFEKLLYVPLPSPDDRGMILKTLARKKPVDPNFDLMAFGRDSACDNLSGADLCFAAGMAAFVERRTSPNQSCDGVKCMIKSEHFKRALGEIRPSVSKKQIKHYERLAKRFSAM